MADPLQVGRVMHLGELGQTLHELAAKGKPNGGGLSFVMAFRNISFYLAQQVKFSFDSQRSPDGIAWAKLKRRRPGKRNKGKKGLGAKPLRNTNLLMNSMQGRIGNNTPGSFLLTGPMFLEQGTNVFYAGWHQDGTMDYRGLGTVSAHIPGKKGIPARQFAGVVDSQIRIIENMVADDVVRQLGGK